ncbi:MAG: class I SAM-dependent methyltransferase [Candidatus Angelobacter sp.]
MNADSKPAGLIAASAETEFSFWHAFARHWQASVRYYGLRNTLSQVSEAAYRFFREFLPDRRKAKFGDLDYDFDHMVDTTRANVGFRAQLTAALSGHQYFPTEPWLFEQIMHALHIEFEDFTFVDLGSGKGRVLLMAAPYGFKEIIGVEYMPEWHHIAEQNIRKFAKSRAADNESIPAITSLCMDARDFDFPAGPLVVYLFNPFPEPIMAAVLERLQQSLLKNPRPLLVAYRYPELETLLKQSEWLEKIAGTEQWVVYSNRRNRT